jgi:hypothetical protein
MAKRLISGNYFPLKIRFGFGSGFPVDIKTGV